MSGSCRTFREFSFKGANFRIYSSYFSAVTEEIKEQRKILEDYIEKHPEFLSSLKPLSCRPHAPVIVKSMCAASLKTSVGPMAAVAGTFSQLAATKAISRGDKDVIVENGGDMYLASREPIVIGIYAGKNTISGKLAFYIRPQTMPLALCSSSGTMGHSLSFGTCDLATVAAPDAALADAAATLAGNRVSHSDDINPTLEHIMSIDGVSGVLIIKDEKIGLAGDLPEIIRHDDLRFLDKVTREKNVWILENKGEE